LGGMCSDLYRYIYNKFVQDSLFVQLLSYLKTRNESRARDAKQAW